MKISIFQRWPEGFVLFGINGHAIGFPNKPFIIKHKDIQQLKRLADRLPVSDSKG